MVRSLGRYVVFAALFAALCGAGALLFLARSSAPEIEAAAAATHEPEATVAEAPAVADDPAPEAARAAVTVTLAKPRTLEQIAQSAPVLPIKLRVEDSNGKPIAGAKVTLRPDGADRAYGLLEGFEKTAKSSAEGNVAFDVHPFGTYKATLQKAGYARSDVTPLFPGDDTVARLAPGVGFTATVVDDLTGKPVEGAVALLDGHGVVRAVESDRAGTVEYPDLAEDLYALDVFAPGFDRLRVDGLQVERAAEPPPPLEVRLAAGIAVVGVVRSQKGDGVAAADVVVRVERAVDGKSTPVLEVATKTDAAGNYRVDGAPRGIGLLVVHAGGFAEERMQLRDSDDPDELHLDVQLKPAVEATGRVHDVAGNAVAGAEIRLRRRDGGADSTVLAATSDLTGEFRLENLKSEKPFDVLVRGPDSALAPAVLRDIVIPPEGRKDPIDVALEPAAQLSGHVTLADKSPAIHARVIVTDVSDSVWRALESAPVTFTDEMGLFRMSGLPAKNVTVRAELAGMRSAAAPVVLPAGAETTCELTLDKSAVLHGFVVDLAGQPVEGVRVTASAQTSSFQTGVTFPAAKKGAAAPQDPKKPLPSIQLGDRAIDLNEWQARADDSRWSLLGRATGGRDRMSILRGSATTDAAGRFEIRGLDLDEKLILIVRDPDYETYLEFDVAPAAGDYKVELTPLIQLRGRVVDARTYRPVTEFTVDARPVEDPPPSIRSINDVMKLRRRHGSGFRSEDGSFVLRGLSPGRWDVVVRGPGYKDAAAQRISLARGARPQLLMELMPTAWIRGKVIARDDSPVRRVPVSLRTAPVLGPDGKPIKQPRANARRTETNGRGEFSFNDLDPGDYVLSLGPSNKPIAGEAVRIALHEGELKEHVFNVGAVGDLALEVEGIGGFGVPRANVSLAGTGTRVRQRGRTDGLGRVAFSNLLPDDYRIVVDVTGYQKGTESVKIRGDDDSSETIHLSPK